MQAPPEQTQADLPYMEAHHFDPSTGEDELACAGATLQPAMVGNDGAVAVRAADRNPKDPTSWGKVGRNENYPCGSG